MSQDLKMSMASVASGFYGGSISLPVFLSSKGNVVLSHSGLKAFVLSIMQRQITGNAPGISYRYQTVKADTEHSVVNCCFSMGNYIVTESGEATSHTLYTRIAQNYPYLEAQKRAFDRAAISFFQLQLDGKRVHTDSEIEL